MSFDSESDDANGGTRPGAEGAEMTTGPKTPPEYELVPTDALAPVPWPSRVGVVPQEADEELDASVQTYGILHPLLVMMHYDERVIVAGMRRWASAKRIGLAQVPVRNLVGITIEQAMAIGALENTAREKAPIWSCVLAVRHLLEKKPDATIEYIREYTPWSVGKVSMLRKVALALPAELLDAGDFRDEDMGVLAGVDLVDVANVTDAGERLLALDELLTARRSVEDRDAEAVGATVTRKRSRRGRRRGRSSSGGVALVSSRLTAKRSSIGIEHSIVTDACKPKVIQQIILFADHLGAQFDGLGDAVRQWAQQQGIEPEPDAT